MPKISAGILMYRRRDGALQVLLVHPGGPYWSGKDSGAWSIPKGLIDPGEDPLEAALREFEEETSCELGDSFLPLSPIKTRSGKWIHAWAVEGDCDASAVKSNTFEMEWPPKSGIQREFPEVDEGGWFHIDEARKKINKSQERLLDELLLLLHEKN